MISTRNLTELPSISSLKRLTQSLATLDAILCKDWEGRYYSFNSQWNESEMMASMRNGSGDEWYLLFCPAGAIMKGFALEYVMNDGPPWPGVLSDVPPVFNSFLNQPAFSMQFATFCVWQTSEDSRWQTGTIDYPSGEDPDGSTFLMELLDGNPETYLTYVRDYFEVEPPLAAIEHIYQHRPLTQTIVTMLNPEVSLDELAEDLEEIGYPG